MAVEEGALRITMAAKECSWLIPGKERESLGYLQATRSVSSRRHCGTSVFPWPCHLSGQYSPMYVSAPPQMYLTLGLYLTKTKVPNVAAGEGRNRNRAKVWYHANSADLLPNPHVYIITM